MNWIATRNNKPVRTAGIPRLTIAELRREILDSTADALRPVSFFAHPENGRFTLFAVLADDENSNILISSAVLDSGASYPSLTPEAPAFHLFERALHEDTGILPEGHPWLKPVRFPYHETGSQPDMEGYPFFTMEGEEVHEVAVGPVHAGVIEPGHFRFMCNGEMVYHLEIQLGYQHRGVERLFTRAGGYQPHLAESIAGDSAIAHATAHANAVEALAGIEIPRRAMTIRAIALELERMAIHIGDLGAIANDVGYLMGSAMFGAIRTPVINTLLDICGSRFGRGLIRLGGVAFDMDGDMRRRVREKLGTIYRDFDRMRAAMLDSPSVLARLEHTGVVSTETARAIGMVGPAGRASGVSLDIRSDHPFGIYRYFPVHHSALESGDVFARTLIRTLEIEQSYKFIEEQLGNFPEETALTAPAEQMERDAFTVSLVEGWRGEIAHCALTDDRGIITDYRIKDPSFNNWYGLALAVRNNGISDFPLCNKSFNLSYCGHDL